MRRSGAGVNAEEGDTLPRLEHFFCEASVREVPAVGMIGLGNEIGGGTIGADVRRISRNADVCRYPGGAGNACAIKTGIVFPAGISDWTAHDVSAMLAYLLGKPDALKDDDTESRMFEARAMSGAVDGMRGRLFLALDGIGPKGQQGIVNLLHDIVENGLKRP